MSSPAHALLQTPLWQATELGKAIPSQAGQHAVSVCLPRWADVLDYETGEKRVLDALQAGYPRFRLPDSVLALGRSALPHARLALPFPLAAATRISQQLKAQQLQACRANCTANCQVVGVFCPAGEQLLRQSWRSCGEGISSRRAETLLQGLQSPEQAPTKNTEAQHALCTLLATSYQIAPTHLFVFPTGMAAHAALLRSLQILRGDLPSYQFGFPYVDCLRLQESIAGVEFARTEALSKTLSWLQQENSTASQTHLALFCETVTNPLLQVLPLAQLHHACQQAQLPFIVDDSVASSGLLQSLPRCDALTSSLTKWVSGHSDVMGGIIALNPCSPWAAALQPLLQQAASEIPLAEEDAEVLLEHAQEFPARVQQAARNAYQVGHWLEQQSALKQIWWTQSRDNLAHWQELVTSPELADQAAVPLLSLQLHSETAAARFYDSLQISKGPSFGCEWSLACPYTLLAHYDELDWCATQGVPRDLIRLSIGLEHADELISRLKKAMLC